MKTLTSGYSQSSLHGLHQDDDSRMENTNISNAWSTTSSDRSGLGSSTDQRYRKPKGLHPSLAPPANLAKMASKRNNGCQPGKSNSKNKFSESGAVGNYQKLLKFYLYFREGVPESNVEIHRVRKCALSYYLEDGTIKISEPRIRNSGLPQGTFLKRSMVTNPVTKLPFQAIDFMVGAEVRIVGHVFHVVRCDPLTRKYFTEELQTQMPSNGSYPDDNHSASMRAQKMEADPRRSRINPLTEVRSEDKLRGFLQFDRKVLRFQCEWDDTSKFDGEVHNYVLHFYLADDTVEMKEVRDENDGHDPFPLLLNRRTVPLISMHQNGQGAYQHEHFAGSRVISSGKAASQRNLTASDLICGEKFQIFGRCVLLQSCDKFTHDFYEHKLGIQQVLEENLPTDRPPAGSRQSIREMQRTRKGAFENRDRPPSRSQVPYNPHVHFGSEDDTTGLELDRFMKHDHLQILRFVAGLASEKPEDQSIERERRFVINFHLTDNTLAIFETAVRNSGMSGGKFLARGRYKIGPSASSTFGDFAAVQSMARWVEPADLMVGRNLSLIHPQTLAKLPAFEFLSADDFTREYVAVANGSRKNSAQFQLDKSGAQFLSDNEEDLGSCAGWEAKQALLSFQKAFQRKRRKLEKAFRHFDTDFSDRVNKAGFASVLSACDTELSDKDQAALISLLFTPGGIASSDHCSEKRRQLGAQCIWINYTKFLDRAFGAGY